MKILDSADQVCFEQEGDEEILDSFLCARRQLSVETDDRGPVEDDLVRVEVLA